MTGTINLASAAATMWDAVVIGAGPAGAVAARALGQQKIRTLLLERKLFPRFKVCGACLNQQAVSWLEVAGLSGRLVQLGAVPTRRFLALCGGSQVELNLPGGFAVSREALDCMLVNAAIESGAEFLPGVTARVTGERRRSGERTLSCRAVEERPYMVRAKVVIAADGLGHPSLSDTGEFVGHISQQSRIGVGTRIAEGCAAVELGTIAMAAGRGGYVGMVRIEDGAVNLAAAIAPEWLRQTGSPEAAVTGIFKEAGLNDVCLSTVGAWRGTPLLTRQTPKIAGHRIFIIGDAAGYVEPFTGEGMTWALAGGLAVAPLVARALARWDQSIEDEWLRLHRCLVRDRQLWCRGFATLLRYPRLARRAVQVAARWPGLCRPIISSLNRPGPPREVCPS